VTCATVSGLRRGERGLRSLATASVTDGERPAPRRVRSPGSGERDEHGGPSAMTNPVATASRLRRGPAAAPASSHGGARERVGVDRGWRAGGRGRVAAGGQPFAAMQARMQRIVASIYRR